MIKNKIKKIIDEYYSEKLIQMIENNINVIFYLDLKTEKHENRYFIYVKRKEYNDLQYTHIYNFREKDALFFLLDQQEFKKTIRKIIDEYLETSRGE